MASRITLRQLEIFLSVIEHGSFRRASGFLGMSTDSIFVRGAQGLSPNDFVFG